MNRKRELRVIDYLQHILDAIERIESYLADSDEQTFAQSFMAQDAVIRNLEIIGEAAVNIRSLDAATAGKYPAIPGRALVNLPLPCQKWQNNQRCWQSRIPVPGS